MKTERQIKIMLNKVKKKNCGEIDCVVCPIRKVCGEEMALEWVLE